MTRWDPSSIRLVIIMITSLLASLMLSSVGSGKDMVCLIVNEDIDTLGVQWATTKLISSYSEHNTKVTKSLYSTEEQLTTLLSNSNGRIILAQTLESHVIQNIIKAGDMESLGDEGFIIKKASIANKELTVVTGNTFAGVMYGLLSLTEQGNVNSDYILEEPALKFRLKYDTFPFYLGMDWYSWGSAEDNNDNNFNWWWYSKDYWTKWFKELALDRVNGIVFNHSHPFPALIRYEGKNGQKYYEVFNRGGSEQIAIRDIDRSIEMFSWILNTAGQYNIKIWLLTWNIATSLGRPTRVLHPNFVDTEINREYAKYTYSKLIETYPNLGGIVTLPGENPLGCTDYVVEGIVAGLNEAGGQVPLVFWPWTAGGIEDVQKVIDAHNGDTYIGLYGNGEHTFIPDVDGRVKRLLEKTQGAKGTIVFVPSGFSFVFWDDPEFKHRFILSLNDTVKSVDDSLEAGVFIQSWSVKKAYGLTGWYRAAWSAATHDFDKEYWISQAGETTFEAATAASRIYTDYGLLTSMIWYYPQFGSLLGSIYHGEPGTYGDVGFLGYYPGPQGNYPGRAGQPIPDQHLWSEDVIPIYQWASKIAYGIPFAESEVTPLMLAERIEQNVAVLESIPEFLRDDYLEVALWRGKGCSQRIYAACNWVLYKMSGNTELKDLSILQLKKSNEFEAKSNEYWKKTIPGWASYLSEKMDNIQLVREYELALMRKDKLEDIIHYKYGGPEISFESSIRDNAENLLRLMHNPFKSQRNFWGWGGYKGDFLQVNFDYLICLDRLMLYTQAGAVEPNLEVSYSLDSGLTWQSWDFEASVEEFVGAVNWHLEPHNVTSTRTVLQGSRVWADSVRITLNQHIAVDEIDVHGPIFESFPIDLAKEENGGIVVKERQMITTEFCKNEKVNRVVIETRNKEPYPWVNYRIAAVDGYNIQYWDGTDWKAPKIEFAMITGGKAVIGLDAVETSKMQITLNEWDRIEWNAFSEDKWGYKVYENQVWSDDNNWETVEAAATIDASFCDIRVYTAPLQRQSD